MALPSPEKQLLNEGMELFRNGELGKAEIIFRDFLAKYPEHDLADNACYNLAKVYMKRQERVKAISCLDYLLEHFPKSDAAYFAVDEKIELLREMGQGPAETADEAYFKAKTLMGKGKLDEAEALFQTFLGKYSDSELIDNAHYNLALIFKKRGQTDKVKAQVDIILKQYPDSDAAIYAADLLKE